MGRGSLPGGKAFQASAVDQKNVEPAIVVVIVESDAAAGGLQQIFVFVFAAENCFHVESGFAGHVDKTDAQGARGGRRRWLGRGGVCGLRDWQMSAFCRRRPKKRENILKREHQRRTTQGAKKCPPRREQKVIPSRTGRVLESALSS